MQTKNVQQPRISNQQLTKDTMNLTAEKCRYMLPIAIPNLKYLDVDEPLVLESGATLPNLTIAYHTFGELNEERDNVIWVFHALTANSDVSDWWSGLFGAGELFDPEKYFIVCANILGSCYGTTGPRSINPLTGNAYGMDFPNITIRDCVSAHLCLKKHLGIDEIYLAIGGSCGGHQVQELGFLYPDKIKRLGLLVTSARETPWAISIHEAGRMALENDVTFYENEDKAGAQGLRTARGIGLLGYRTVDAYIKTQSDTDERTDDFKASSYVRYQGDKLERRFYAHCYWHLLKALDTHHIGRGRGGVEKALSKIPIPTLVMSIASDMLIPPSQQKILAQHLPMAKYVEIPSAFGHDGFLIETDAIGQAFMSWLEEV